MTADPLKTLIAVRRRAEAACEEALAAAVAIHAEARRGQGRLDAATDRERKRLDAARAQVSAGGRAADLIAERRFLERLAAELDLAKSRADAHRRGPLRVAGAAEARAREALLAARREREVAEALWDRQRVAAERVAGRREEAARDDAALRGYRAGGHGGAEVGASGSSGARGRGPRD